MVSNRQCFPLLSAGFISSTNWLDEISADSDYSKQIKIASDYIETERLIQGVPGVTVAVIKDNQLIWSQGFGYSPDNIKYKLFMSVDNKYDYGVGWNVIRDWS